eukprot:scaffold2188_cov388-Prasinococcus_capsulatus_cf.AAC.2
MASWRWWRGWASCSPWSCSFVARPTCPSWRACGCSTFPSTTSDSSGTFSLGPRAADWRARAKC